MDIGLAILLVLLIGIVAAAANVDLANNATILLVLLLALVAYNKASQENCACRRTIPMI